MPLPNIPHLVAVSRRRENWPRHTNYMSDIGHPCERFLTYARTHYEQRQKPSDYLLGIFADGQTHEDAVLHEMRVALTGEGYRIQEEQMRLFDQDLKLSGKVDGRLVDNKTRESWIFEVKSMSPYTWDKIDSHEDLLNARWPWIRHYPAQMQCYLHYDRERNKKESQGLFILKNKATNQWKQVEIPYDDEMALALMLKAERINQAVDRVQGVGGTVDESKLPERISFAEGLCENCDFRAICLPDFELGAGIEVVHDEGLLDLLRQREEHIQSHQIYQRLDKLAKEALRGRDMVMIGEFVCRSKPQKRKSYVVPARTQWTTTIKRRDTEEVD